MVRIIIAEGHIKYNNVKLTRAFLVPTEAEQFLEGLINTKVNILTAKNYIELFNVLLKRGIYNG